LFTYLKNEIMKKIFVFALVLLLAVPAFSQVKFGIKAGGQSTSFPDYTLGSGAATVEALADASWGFHAGLFARISLLGFFIQPEAVFATNSFEYTVKEVASDPGSIVSQKFNRLSIPVLVGFKLGPLRINAGPAASIQLGSPQDLISDPNFEDMYKSAVWGYQAGVGLDLLKKFTLDARYAGSLGDKYGDSVTISGQNFKLDYAQPSFILSFGFIF
jgi:hypothetical protein